MIVAATTPMRVPRAIAHVLVIPLVNCLRKITETSTINPKARFEGEPKSCTPTPPAKFLIPTGSRDSPMDNTTTPVTIGGKNFLILLINVPRKASNIPPTRAAPRTPYIPYLLPIESATGTKAKLVPTTTGSLAPIFPIL